MLIAKHAKVQLLKIVNHVLETDSISIMNVLKNVLMANSQILLQINVKIVMKIAKLVMVIVLLAV